jgi:hypothetical protein
VWHVVVRDGGLPYEVRDLQRRQYGLGKMQSLRSGCIGIATVCIGTNSCASLTARIFPSFFLGAVVEIFLITVKEEDATKNPADPLMFIYKPRCSTITLLYCLGVRAPVESLEHYRAQDSRSGFWSDDVSGVSVALVFVLTSSLFTNLLSFVAMLCLWISVIGFKFVHKFAQFPYCSISQMTLGVESVAILAQVKFDCWRGFRRPPSTSLTTSSSARSRRDAGELPRQIEWA